MNSLQRKERTMRARIMAMAAVPIKGKCSTERSNNCEPKTAGSMAPTKFKKNLQPIYCVMSSAENLAP
jgi:hypothetical protein